MSQIPTVKIKSGDDYLIINEDDFDETIHELFDETDVGKPSESPKTAKRGRPRGRR